MKRFTYFFFGILVFCLLLGTFLELVYGEQGPNAGLMFQRSGALFVIFGTAAGLIDPGRTLHVGHLVPPEEFARIQSAQAEKDAIQMLNAQAKLTMLLLEARNQVLTYVAYVLIVGTAIWGFGDLAWRWAL